MSKDELVKKVKDLGYEAEMIDNIPYILNLDYNTAKEIIKKLDYVGTYGVKPIKRTTESNNILGLNDPTNPTESTTPIESGGE